jgi:D-3-phosphoglycerate dehydrogenase / 2-oxoglutarate reductase
MTRMIIAITTSSFAQDNSTPLELIREKGFEIRTNLHGRKLQKEETIALCSGCTAIIAGTETYDREVLERLGSVKVISRCGTGIDNIDVPAMRKLGMKLFNTPDAPTLAVAELTIGLILSLLRNIPRLDAEIHHGTWKKRMGNLLNQKQVGVIGFGRIGRKVADLLVPFACRIVYHDISKDLSADPPYVEPNVARRTPENKRRCDAPRVNRSRQILDRRRRIADHEEGGMAC